MGAHAYARAASRATHTVISRGNQGAIAEHALVASRRLHRAESFVQDLLDFFGEGVPLTSVLKEYAPHDHLMAQRAIPALLPDWRLVREVSYCGLEPTLVKRMAVSTGPKTHGFAIGDGRQYWRSPEGECLAVDFLFDSDFSGPYCEVTFHIPEDRHAWLAALLARMQEWMDANHVVRGQAIKLTGEFIDLSSAIPWEQVLAGPDVREHLERQCIGLFARAPLYRANGVPLKRGILLHGKPGTGKTTIGMALATRTRTTFIVVSPGMVQTAPMVARAFEWARRFAPTVLLFEDFDMVAADREDSHGAEKTVLGEFLSCLDGPEKLDGVVVIATTNDLEAIEPALRERPNRFDLVLEVKPPDADLRRAYVDRWLAARPHEVDRDRIVARTEGYTGAQLQELCRSALFHAVEERAEAGCTDGEVVAIHDRHLEAAFGNGRGQKRRAIGFHTEAEE